MQGERTLAELTLLYDGQSYQITTLRTGLLEGAAGVFRSGSATGVAPPAIDEQAIAWSAPAAAAPQARAMLRREAALTDSARCSRTPHWPWSSLRVF